MTSFVQDGSNASPPPKPRLNDFFYLEDFGFEEDRDSTAAIAYALEAAAATQSALVIRPRHMSLIPPEFAERCEVVATLPDLFRAHSPEEGNIVRVQPLAAA